MAITHQRATAAPGELRWLRSEITATKFPHGLRDFLDAHPGPALFLGSRQVWALAMNPMLRDPALPAAIDNLPYRARRIFFPAVAFVAGGGRPEWILPVYAALNFVCWPLLALVLLQWFPPRSWENFLRWAGVLFSAGLLASVRSAVVDGPALLLLALAVALLERGRPRAGLALLALGGLGKETSLLGAVALAPGATAGVRAWLRAAGRGLLVAAPLAAWLAYVALRAGPAMDAGTRNFDWPLAGYVARWREIAPGLAPGAGRTSHPLGSALILVALLAQALAVGLRPQWDRLWWRIGAAYAGFLLILGAAVWEGFPGAEIPSATGAGGHRDALALSFIVASST